VSPLWKPPCETVLNKPKVDITIGEAEIDTLVYQLYGLTEDEIKIVEGS
jgi:hypothetical protein